MSKPAEEEREGPSIPWPDIVKFVRQLSHDIRNNLNAVELQSAYLAEIAEEDEIKTEIQRLRQMISEIGTSLQRLTAGLAQSTPRVVEYRAADFMEDLRQKISNDFGENAAKISWSLELKDQSLRVDPLLAQQAFLELFANAFQHERNVKSIEAKAYTTGDRFIFELREPKAKFEGSAANWGRQPLRNVSQGHYGLGLHRARAVVEAHGGELDAEYDRASSTLISRLSLPINRDLSR
jgi:K+-sensing histidine kinase KdpD